MNYVDGGVCALSQEEGHFDAAVVSSFQVTSVPPSAPDGHSSLQVAHRWAHDYQQFRRRWAEVVRAQDRRHFVRVDVGRDVARRVVAPAAQGHCKKGSFFNFAIHLAVFIQLAGKGRRKTERKKRKVLMERGKMVSPSFYLYETRCARRLELSSSSFQPHLIRQTFSELNDKSVSTTMPETRGCRSWGPTFWPRASCSCGGSCVCCRGIASRPGCTVSFPSWSNVQIHFYSIFWTRNWSYLSRWMFGSQFETADWRFLLHWDSVQANCFVRFTSHNVMLQKEIFIFIARNFFSLYYISTTGPN